MYKLLITNQRNKNSYDVSTIANSIEYFTSILGQPGKLSFILEKDPNNILELCEGNIVIFSTDEGNVFYGYIFTIGTDSTEAYRVVAYDQTRYLKNRDTMFVENQTIDQMFESICKRNSTPKFISKVKSTYILKSRLYNNNTYFEMLDSAIQETLQNSPNTPYFFIRDNFGVLELNELMSTKKDWIIGDESLLTDYKYEVDIDKDTFNRIKIISGNKEKGLTVEHIEQDVKTIAEYGVLQKLVTVSEIEPLQAKQFAKLYLQLKNRPFKTIQIEALGIQDLNAGDGFIFQLNKLGVYQRMFILSATHRYDADSHTMSLEVSGFGSLSDLPKKSKNELICEIVDGQWGVGDVRKNNLTEAGYNYFEIQSEINKLYAVARSVVSGAYGEVPIVGGKYVVSESVKISLTSLGYDYNIIEKIMYAPDF